MKTNKSIQYAFIGAYIILFTLISIAYGDKNYQTTTMATTSTLPVKSCAWSESWGNWSECKDGFQTRTKLCTCVNLHDDKDDKGGQMKEEDDKDDKGGYKRGVPSYTTTKKDNSGKKTSGEYTVVTQPKGFSYSGKETVGDSGKHTGDYSGKHTSGDKTVTQPKDNDKDEDCDEETPDYSSDKQTSGVKTVTKPKSSGKQTSGVKTVTKPKDNDKEEDEDIVYTCSGDQPTEKRSCPSTKTLCEWGDWGEFSECSKSCGGGVKTRTRQCKCEEVEEDEPTTDYSSGSDVKSDDFGSKSNDHSYTTTVYKRNGGLTL